MTQIVQWGEHDPNLSLIGIIQLDTNTRQIVNVYQHITTVGVCAISHVGTEKQEFKWGATCFIRDSLEAINTFWATVGCICYTPTNINHFLPNEDGTWPFTLPGSIHYGFDISEAHPCHLRRKIEDDVRLRAQFMGFQQKCVQQFHEYLHPKPTVQCDE